MLTYLIIVPFMGILTLLNSAIYGINIKNISKWVVLWVIITNFIISLLIFILKDPTSEQFEFGSENSYIQSYLNLNLATDNTSLFFVLLVSVIFPIALLSNWKSIKSNSISFLIIILLLQILLQLVFVIEDTLLYYVFFESILAPLFILIGLFGSTGRIKASYYIFLYTLIGSLFMLLSVINILSYIGVTEFLTIFKINFLYLIQVFMFFGIFIAFAVKTPVIYLNNWLLKAHVESPLSGSIILAAIVLKLSLYGIIRLIIPFFPEAVIYITPFIFTIGVLTIIYASLSTIRITDIKELIAYSSVSHAAVYLLGIFSNVIQGIIGAIVLGIAHAFSSSGLFTSVGGVLYDRYYTRLISYFRGIAQIMPIFCILFFLLCLANCGVPLTLNFIGEFTSLFGTFSRLPFAGFLATLSSVILSACYTIYMYNRIAFAGSFYKYINIKVKDFNIRECLPDLGFREFFLLFILLYLTFLLGIYPCFILDNIFHDAHYLIFNYSMRKTYMDSPYPYNEYLNTGTTSITLSSIAIVSLIIITYFIIKKYKKHFTISVIKTNLNLINLVFAIIGLIITTYIRLYHWEDIMNWLIDKNKIFLGKGHMIEITIWLSTTFGAKAISNLLSELLAPYFGYEPMLMGGGEKPSSLSQDNKFINMNAKTDSNPGTRENTPEPESSSEKRKPVRKSGRLKDKPSKNYNINKLSQLAESNRIEKKSKSKVGTIAKKLLAEKEKDTRPVEQSILSRVNELNPFSSQQNLSANTNTEQTSSNPNITEQISGDINIIGQASSDTNIIEQTSGDVNITTNTENSEQTPNVNIIEETSGYTNTTQPTFDNTTNTSTTTTTTTTSSNTQFIPSSVVFPPSPYANTTSQANPYSVNTTIPNEFINVPPSPYANTGGQQNNDLGSQQNPVIIRSGTTPPAQPVVTTEEIGAKYPNLTGNEPYYTLMESDYPSGSQKNPQFIEDDTNKINIIRSTEGRLHITGESSSAPIFQHNSGQVGPDYRDIGPPRGAGVNKTQSEIIEKAKARWNSYVEPDFSSRRLQQEFADTFRIRLDDKGRPIDYDIGKTYINWFNGKLCWHNNDWGIFVRHKGGDSTLVVRLTKFNPNGDNSVSLHNMKMGLCNQREIGNHTFGKIITKDPEIFEFLHAHIKHNIPNLHDKIQRGEITLDKMRIDDEFIDTLPLKYELIRPDKTFNNGVFDWILTDRYIKMLKRK